MTMKMMLVALCAMTAVFRLNAADPQENKDGKDSKEVASADKGSSKDSSSDNKPADTKADTKDAK